MALKPLVTLPPALADGAPRPVEPRLLLGVDGGATKTLAGAFELRSGRLALGHGGPSNPDAVGSEPAARAVIEAASKALAAIAADARPDAAVLGIAGTDTAAVERALAGFEGHEWVVVNDVVSAWAVASDAGPGLAAIAGTGSNVFGVGPSGAPWRAGGWGHVLGDEGSGYWLGLHALKACLLYRDGRGPASALTEMAPAFFGVVSIEQLAAVVYAKPLSKAEIASFTVRVAEAAAAGDAVARDLYRQAARDIAAQIRAVVANTGLDGEFPVGLVGSAFRAGELFTAPLREDVRAFAPAARVSTVEMAPVGGALLLAARAAGLDVSAARERIAPALAEALAAP